MTGARVTRSKTARSVLVGVMLLAVAAPQARDRSAHALERLKAGNTRFLNDATTHAPRPRGIAPATPEPPLATVVSCSDAHVPPELVFDSGHDELFVVRGAGHVTDRTVLGSVEFAVGELRSPLIVVMGHEACDVVRHTMDGRLRNGSHLDHLAKGMAPALERARDASDDALRAAILENVEQSINDLLEKSPVVARLASRGDVQLVGAYAEAATGRVHFSKPVRRSARSTAGTAQSPRH